jgi:hypothetical protein
MSDGRKPVLLIAILVSAFLAFSAVAQADIYTALDSPHPGTPGVITPVTGPNNGDPQSIVLNYLHQNAAQLGLTQNDLSDVSITSY